MAYNFNKPTSKKLKFISFMIIRLTLGAGFFLHGFGKLPIPPEKLSSWFESIFGTFVLVPRQLTFLPWSECYCLFQPRYLFRKLPSSSPSEVASHSDVPFATRSLRKTRCRSIDRSRTSAYIHQPQRNTIFHTLRVVSA